MLQYILIFILIKLDKQLLFIIQIVIIHAYIRLYSNSMQFAIHLRNHYKYIYYI